MNRYHLQNRPDRELKESEDIDDILKNGQFAVLSLCRDNEPYVVTLSYGYDKGRNALYFHCAKEGLKLEFLRANSHVCATVIEDGGYIADECGHAYRTVVFRGPMQPVDELEEKKHGMGVLLRHLEKNSSVIQAKLRHSEKFYSKMEILRMDIQQIQGKAGR